MRGRRKKKEKEKKGWAWKLPHSREGRGKKKGKKYPANMRTAQNCWRHAGGAGGACLVAQRAGFGFAIPRSGSGCSQFRLKQRLSQCSICNPALPVNQSRAQPPLLPPKPPPSLRSAWQRVITRASVAPIGSHDRLSRGKSTRRRGWGEGQKRGRG